MNDILWSPKDNAHQLAAFTRAYAARTGERFADYAALHAHSVSHRDLFWRAVWEHCGVVGTPGELVLARDRLPGSRWFPAARVNFTENLLRRRDDTVAVIERDEQGSRLQWSWRELDDAVRETAAGLRDQGVGIGDRIAAIAPNRFEALVLVLASAAIGAIFSSCSPDFGEAAIIDRFAQITPTVLAHVDGYVYAGKQFDTRAKCDAVAAALPSVRLRVRLDRAATSSLAQGAESLAGLRRYGRLEQFPRLPFAQPLYVMFSSGTTGLPKCITHGAGGTLLAHLCEQRLHCDFRAGERVFFFTTCGWMMWNWLVSALSSECTLCLYDGSPLHPDPEVLTRYAAHERVVHFGISPGYLSQLAKLGQTPHTAQDLSALRSVLSTGSPLAPELFRFCAERVVPNARLSSITGGTDIMGCFAMGNPGLPVRVGEIQCAALGKDIAFVDDTGEPVGVNEPGELICRSAFPSEPLGFWNDPDGSRYRAAYFERFPGVWHHGDYGEFTEAGGVIIHGRSDATLNRGGVRIGTAEIYRQLEGFPEVLEALAVTQERAQAALRLVLFVKLREGATLDEALAARIRQRLKEAASPRHVPDLLLAAPDLPRTRSGKLTELAVRDVLHGRTVKNVGALANPECLAWFGEQPELG